MNPPSPRTASSVIGPHDTPVVPGDRPWPDGAPRWMHLADLAAWGLARDPAAPAVVFGARTWTAGEVWRASEAVAAAVAGRLGAQTAGARVALLVRRGPAIVTGMIGVVLAGCAVIPLDAAQPASRIAAILRDARPALVIVDDPGTARSAEVPDDAVIVMAARDAVSPLPCAPATPGGGAPRDGGGPAYVIYTSGSTGRPKGVVCHHLGLCNLIEDRLADGRIAPGSRLLLSTSIAFDPAIYNVFLAAASGACLVIADETAASSPDRLAELMRREAVTHVDMPPRLLDALPPGDYPALRAASVGGEACPPRVIERWAARIVLENCYGPTETSVEVTRWRWSRGEPGTRIGRPVRNVAIRVVSADGADADEGELWIGGPMVALGYLHDAGESAARFVRCAATGMRFYRTGDVVRRAADGVLDFVGRLDEQIKIDGVRIEPEEVRAAIEALPGVRRAAVLVETHEGGRRLTGFYAASPDAPDAAGMMAGLARRLPGAMLPARLVALADLPLLPSGKADVAALRRHADAGRAASGTAAPASEVWTYLSALWCRLLGVEQVRPSDNFFELGGDSMRLTQLIFAINKQYRVRLTPAAYRGLSDLGALVAYVETALAQGARR